MRSTNQWLGEYAISHRHPTNQLIHKICVPLIMWSLLGMLWVIPVPATLASFTFNWAYVLMAVAIIFYATMDFRIVIFMGVVGAAMLYGCHVIAQQVGFNYLLYGSIAVFAISWVFQFIGHEIEGKKPSFLTDLVFLLVGPVWVFRPFLSWMGINTQIQTT